MGSQPNTRIVVLRKNGVDVPLPRQPQQYHTTNDTFRGRSPKLPSWDDLGGSSGDNTVRRTRRTHRPVKPIAYVIGLALLIMALVRFNANPGSQGAMLAGMTPSVSTETATDKPARHEHDYPSLSWMSRDEAKAFVASPEGKDIKCLAQVLASETNDPYTMVKVAWVVRNRVEANIPSEFGAGFCGVAFYPNQFSGLHKRDARYKLNISRDYGMTHKSVVEQAHWEEAIRRARAVYYASHELSPLPSDVFFFYSPRSMKGGKYASWADGCKAYDLNRGLEVQRADDLHFAFYRASTCHKQRVYFSALGMKF